MANKKTPQKEEKKAVKKAAPKKAESKKNPQEGLNDAQKVSDVLNNKVIS